MAAARHSLPLVAWAEFDALTGKLREAMALVDLVGPDEGRVFSAAAANTGASPDEDTASFLRALIDGLTL